MIAPRFSFAFLFLVPLAVRAETPPWEGLAGTLSAEFARDIGADPGFLPYAPMQIGRGSPMATGWVVDGTSYPGAFLEIESLALEQRHWASLPAGARIIERPAPGGRSWELPVGARLVHEVRWRSAGRPHFEIRVIQKMAPARWSFGSYLPQTDGSLRLSETLDFVAEKTTIQLEQPGLGSGGAGPSRFEFRRISAKTCASCHRAVAPMAESGATHAGPCGFVPQNEGLRPWAQEYEKRFGYWPFGGS